MVSHSLLGTVGHLRSSSYSPRLLLLIVQTGKQRSEGRGHICLEPPHWGRGLPNHCLLQIPWAKHCPGVTCGESVLLRLVQHFFLASEVGDAEERSRLVVYML